VTFPKQLVHEGEEVLLDTRPHWWRLAGPTLVTAVVVGGCAAIFVVWTGAPRWSSWVLLGAGAVAVGYFLGRLLEWRSTDLVVTTMRVIYRRGVVSRTSREIPISSVQDVSFVQSLGERIIGKGRLSVQSAGVHGEEPFNDVRRPAIVQGLVDRTIEESRRAASVDVAEPGRLPVADELERLAALRGRGIITDREFVRMKAELLADATGRDGDGDWDRSE